MYCGLALIETCDDAVKCVLFELPEKELIEALVASIYNTTKYKCDTLRDLSLWERIKLLFNRTIMLTHAARKDAITAAVVEVLTDFKANSAKAHFNTPTYNGQKKTPFIPTVGLAEYKDVTDF